MIAVLYYLGIMAFGLYYRTEYAGRLYNEMLFGDKWDKTMMPIIIFWILTHWPLILTSWVTSCILSALGYALVVPVRKYVKEGEFDEAVEILHFMICALLFAVECLALIIFAILVIFSN